MQIGEGNDEEVPDILCHQKYLQSWLPRPYGQNNVRIGKSDGLGSCLLSLRTGLVLASIAFEKRRKTPARGPELGSVSAS